MSSQHNYAIENNWLSAYIFYGNAEQDIYGADCDRVIQQVIAPFVARARQARWFTHYFFMRYSERGNHVRLRFQGDPQVLATKVAPALAQWVEDSAVATTLPLRLEWVAYEPEIERYGGPTAITLAETLFEYSSDTCIQVIDKVAGSKHSARLGQALLLMSVLFYTFTDTQEDAKSFAEKYGMGYLQAMIPEAYREHWLGMFNGGFDRQANTLIAYVHEVWERLGADESLTPLLDTFYSQMLHIREQFTLLFEAGEIIVNRKPATEWMVAVRGVVSSYNHMTNNRLGVSIQEEMYLAYLIARALEQENVGLALA